MPGTIRRTTLATLVIFVSALIVSPAWARHHRHAPVNTALPTIGGVPQQGQTLTASQGTWTGTAPINYSYEWSDGTTGSTDTLSAGDAGQTVSVTVTASNSAGSASATSNSVGPVQPLPPPPTPPANTVLPSISGTAQEGDTLSAGQGTWTGTAPISYTYAWSDGATGSTDTLGASDVGQTISVTVTATNSAGSASATSASVGPVTAAQQPVPPSNTQLPVISGTPQQGDTLTVSNGSWSGDAPITYSYSWSDGTTGSSDTLGAGDVGQNITATVTATNDAGHASATSASVGPITATALPPPPGALHTFGFYPGWETDISVANIPWGSITDGILFSDTTNADGTLNTTNHSMSPSLKRAFVSAAHAHGRLALLSIGGSDDRNWSSACSSANRATLAQSIVAELKTYGFDGIDLDIEQDFGNPTYMDLMACVGGIRTALNATTTSLGEKPVLTEDSDPSWEMFQTSHTYQYLDYILLMSYGSKCDTNSCSQVATDISNYTGYGIPKSMLVEGIGLDPGMPDATDPADCTAKAQYATDNNLGGLMIWSIQDDAANNGGRTPCLDNLAPFVSGGSPPPPTTPL
jgi:Glycosyl hydrolases family 18